MEPFERRAAEAEARLAALEKVVYGEAGSEGHGSSLLSSSFDAAELYNSLLTLRIRIGALATHKHTAEEERDEAQKQNKQLQTENAKLKYQIEHLKHALRDADERAPPALPQQGMTIADCTPFNPEDAQQPQ